MSDKFSTYARKPELILAIAALAALTFNNWLLGPFLNKELFVKNGSVSEFSAMTQPHYWVFRGLDIVSGGLFILLALVMSQQPLLSSKARMVLIWGTAVIGAANIIDALFTLQCSETLNAACRLPVNISLNHFQMPSHGYSSVVIAICYFALPLAGFMYSIARKSRELMILSALAMAMALESFLSAIFQYIVHNSFSVKTSGVGQEVQMVVIGVWLIVWAFDACKLSYLTSSEMKKDHV